MYAARVLGPEQYGAFNYAIAIAGFTFLFSDIGISPLFIREYQKGQMDKKKLFGTSFILKSLFAIGSIIISLITFFFIENKFVKEIFLYILILQFLNIGLGALVTIATAHNKSEYNALSIIIDSIVTTLIGLAFLSLSPSLVYFVYAYIIGSFVSLVIIAITTIKIIQTSSPSMTFDTHYGKKLFLFATPFMFGGVVSALLTNTDTVLLGIFKNNITVGEYAPAVRVVGLVFIIPGLINAALFPLLAKFYDDYKKLITLLRPILSYTMMVIIPICIGGVIVASQIIMEFVGPQYHNGILALRILIFVLPLYSLTMTLDNLLFSLNYQVQNLIFTSIAAGVNLILDLMLIPSFSLYGAAIATVIAQAINLALTYRLTKKILHNNSFFTEKKSIIKIIISSLIMGIIVYWMSLFNLNLFLLIFLGAFSYFILLCALKENYILSALRKVTTILRA